MAMIGRRVLLVALLLNALFPRPGISQDQAVSVSAAEDGSAEITFADGKKITVRKEPDQVGISEAQIAPDGTVGWLAEFGVEGVSYPIGDTLILWRAGKILRRFHAELIFWSWTFYASGKQVAYHVGPLHGESKSRCELHDAASGRLNARWDGDLESGNNRPAWTKGLNH